MAVTPQREVPQIVATRGLSAGVAQRDLSAVARRTKAEQNVCRRRCTPCSIPAARWAPRTALMTRSGHFDPDVDYELNPDVEILTGMHDCQLLIDRINGLGDRSRLLDDADAGERAVCLIARSASFTTSFDWILMLSP